MIFRFGYREASNDKKGTGPRRLLGVSVLDKLCYGVRSRDLGNSLGHLVETGQPRTPRQQRPQGLGCDLLQIALNSINTRFL